MAHAQAAAVLCGQGEYRHHRGSSSRDNTDIIGASDKGSAAIALLSMGAEQRSCLQRAGHNIRPADRRQCRQLPLDCWLAAAAHTMLPTLIAASCKVILQQQCGPLQRIERKR